MQQDISDSFDTFDSQLHSAVCKENVEKAKSLLELGCDPNYVCPKYKYPTLPLAIETGNHEIIQLLVNYKADINKTFRVEGGALLTPLLLAINIKDSKSVELIVKGGADVNFRVHKQDLSPLGLAVEKDSREIVEILLKAKANPNYDKWQFYSEHPLFVAFAKQNKVIIDLLLEYGADVDHSFRNEMGFSFMFYAISMGDEDIVESLLFYARDKNALLSKNCGPTLDIFPPTPMNLAVIFNSPGIIQVLIKHGASVDSTSGLFPPLHVAAALNRMKAARFLIDKGAKINQSVPSTQLNYPSFIGRPPPSESPLLGKFIGEQTPLSLACRQGHIDMVGLLLFRGANVTHPKHNLCLKNERFLPNVVGSSRKERDRAIILNLMLLKGLPLSGHCQCHGIMSLLEVCLSRNLDLLAAVLVSHGAEVDLEIFHGPFDALVGHSQENADSLQTLCIKAYRKGHLLNHLECYSTSIWPTISCLRIPCYMKELLQMKQLLVSQTRRHRQQQKQEQQLQHQEPSPQ